MSNDPPDDLEFEMDDDASMAKLLGDGNGDTADPEPSEATALPISVLDLNGGLSMDELMDDDQVPVEDDSPEPAETDAFPNDLFEHSLPLDMDAAVTDSRSMIPVEGTVCDHRLGEVIIELDDGERGHVDASEFGKNARVEIGDRVRVGLSGEAGSRSFVLLEHVHTAQAPGPAPIEPTTAGFRPGTRFVIDGSNVCRSYMDGRGSHLSPLLTLACVILEHGGDFICVFDANERYVLAENGSEPDSQFLYDTLLKAHSSRFIEAPSTGPADDLLLKIAHRERLSVISNDRFDKAGDRHKEQYSWLVPGGSRLLPGTVDFLTLRIPKLKLSVPLETDLRALESRFNRVAGGGR